MARDMLPLTAADAEVPALQFWHINADDRPETKLHKYAYGLLLDEKNWCRRVLAKNKYGAEVEPTSVAAVRFCAQGALMRAAHELELPESVVKSARRAITLALPDVNDFFGRRAALWLIRRAIVRSM